MFGRRKNEDRERRVRQKEKEKKALIRDLYGKNVGRKLFAFRCASSIKATLKQVADALKVNMYALAEHCLQLGAIQVKQALEDPEEEEELRRHLTEDHVEKRTIEKLDRYDQQAAGWLAGERRRRFEIDSAARELILRFGRNLDPDRVIQLIDLGYDTECAIRAGWPPPPNMRGQFRFRTRPRRNTGTVPGSKPQETAGPEVPGQNDASGEPSNRP